MQLKKQEKKGIASMLVVQLADWVPTSLALSSLSFKSEPGSWTYRLVLFITSAPVFLHPQTT
jgi:hypothetical protein